MKFHYSLTGCCTDVINLMQETYLQINVWLAFEKHAILLNLVSKSVENKMWQNRREIIFKI